MVISVLFSSQELQTVSYVNGTVNATTLAADSSYHTGRGVVLIFVIFLGLVFNGFILFAIIPNRKLHTVTNIVVCHLSVTGLTSCLLLLPFNCVACFTQHWPGGDSFCRLHGFMSYVLTSVILWSIVWLSWDKYQTIASPLHYTTIASRKKIAVRLAILWSFSSVLSISPLLGGNHYMYSPVKLSCDLDLGQKRNMWYAIMFISITFCVPFLILIFCYSHLFQIARTHSTRIANMVQLVTLSAHAPITHRRSSAIVFRGRKATWTICLFLGAFMVCYLPYSLTVLAEIVIQGELNSTFVTSVTILFQASVPINAFVYGIRNSILREAFFSYWRKKFRRYSAIMHNRRRDAARSAVRNRNSRSSAVVRPVASVISQPLERQVSPIPFVLPRAQSATADLTHGVPLRSFIKSNSVPRLAPDANNMRVVRIKAAGLCQNTPPTIPSDSKSLEHGLQNCTTL